MAEREMSVRDVRQNLAQVVNETAVQGIVTYLTSRGRRMAKLVPLDESDVVDMAVAIAQERNGS